jgi:hypothetical protein
MPHDYIRINDLEFDLVASDAHPFAVPRPAGGRMLAGLRLTVTAADVARGQQLEALAEQPQVQVDDPFADRVYPARVQVMPGDPDGPIRSYILEAQEIAR